jgi:predicted DNA-binding transcriptional regulator AlpA
MIKDKTFHQDSKAGSLAWVAARLGRSTDWFRTHRETLEQEGFPRPDPIIGLYLKADVDAWLDSRRRTRATVSTTIPMNTGGFNADAL